MNGRIKQLAKESNLMEFIDGLQPIIYAHDIKRVEKFAELIILECLEKIDDTDLTRLEGPDPEDLIWLVTKQLKEHFGVE